MIDIASFNKSLKAVWIKKYLDPENGSKWKYFFDLELKKYRDTAVYNGNLGKNEINKLRISDPFVKEIIEIWSSQAFFEEKVVSIDHLRSMPLRQNSLIRIQNEPILCKEWIHKGVTQVKHLMDESFNFLSLAAYQNKYNFRVKPLTFLGIISAVKLLQRQIPRIQTRYKSSFNQFLQNQTSSRFVYQKLVSNIVEQPTSCQKKWHEDINGDQTENMNWQKSYQLPFTCTKSSKHIGFNFRFFTQTVNNQQLPEKIGIIKRY